MLPVFQGAELAFAVAALSPTEPVAVDLVPIDLAADPGALADVGLDTGFIAAIVAPDVRDVAATRELLDAGLAVVDLAPFGEPPATQEGAWRRLVPPVRSLAEALASRASAAGSRVCLLEDPATSVGLLRPVARALDDVTPITSTPGEAAEAIDRARCRTVVWDGDGTVAVDIATALVGHMRLLGGDRLRDADFVQAAGSAAEGTVSACGCADLSTSTDLAAQRFIQDYQSAYGSPPGPYAAESWDAARLILGALRTAGPTRASVAGWIGAASAYDGLAARYAFQGSGALSAPEAAVRFAEVRGGRWIPLADGS